jgi:hypothetical protein
MGREEFLMGSAGPTGVEIVTSGDAGSSGFSNKFTTGRKFLPLRWCRPHLDRGWVGRGGGLASL